MIVIRLITREGTTDYPALYRPRENAQGYLLVFLDDMCIPYGFKLAEEQEALAQVIDLYSREGNKPRAVIVTRTVSGFVPESSIRRVNNV
jgi:hypothetical protein